MSGVEKPDRVRVVFRRVQRTESENGRALAVFCQRQGSAVELRDCRTCDHCRGLCVDPSDRQTFLRCTFGEPAEPPHTPAPESQPERRRSPAETRLGEIMTSPVRCARRDMDIQALTGLFLEQAISAVPVIDDTGRAVGVVSKTDLLRRYYTGSDEETSPASATEDGLAVEMAPGLVSEHLRRSSVADVMTHVVFCLDEAAPVSRAAALMSYEGVHRLVITDAAGRAIGIVSSLDILRWMAREDGYLVPHPGRPPKDADGAN